MKKIYCNKTPSFIHKVIYDQIVNELWEIDLTKKIRKENRKHHLWNATHNTAQKSFGFTL